MSLIRQVPRPGAEGGRIGDESVVLGEFYTKLLTMTIGGLCAFRFYPTNVYNQ